MRKPNTSIKSEKSKIIKARIPGTSIIEHLDNMTINKKPWADYTAVEAKSISPFAINRWLSMNYNFIEFINMLQKYTVGLLDTREVYKLYLDLLPKQKTYSKYIKGNKEALYSEDLIGYFTKYFEVSTVEAKTYLDIYFKTPEGMTKVREILEKYGLEEKKINKIINIKL